MTHVPQGMGDAAVIPETIVTMTDTAVWHAQAGRKGGGPGVGHVHRAGREAA